MLNWRTHAPWGPNTRIGAPTAKLHSSDATKQSSLNVFNTTLADKRRNILAGQLIKISCFA
jgi:hypothetical protein